MSCAGTIVPFLAPRHTTTFVQKEAHRHSGLSCPAWDEQRAYSPTLGALLLWQKAMFTHLAQRKHRQNRDIWRDLLGGKRIICRRICTISLALRNPRSGVRISQGTLTTTHHLQGFWCSGVRWDHLRAPPQTVVAPENRDFFVISLGPPSRGSKPEAVECPSSCHVRPVIRRARRGGRGPRCHILCGPLERPRPRSNSSELHYGARCQVSTHELL